MEGLHALPDRLQGQDQSVRAAAPQDLTCCDVAFRFCFLSLSVVVPGHSVGRRS